LGRIDSTLQLSALRVTRIDATCQCICGSDVRAVEADLADQRTSVPRSFAEPWRTCATESPRRRHQLAEPTCQHREMRKAIILFLFAVVLAVFAPACAVWLAPAFSEPPHRPKDCAGEGPCGFDLASGTWGCLDNQLVRVGRFGINGV
jgi:hypothetical protein